MSKQKKKVNIPKVLVAVVLVLVALEMIWLLFDKFSTEKNLDSDTPTTGESVQQEQAEPQVTQPAAPQEPRMPWEEAGAKQPGDYTWEEYEALTGDQKKAFRDYLGDAYAQWLDNVREQAAVNPWDELGAKQPEDYAWAEFEALTGSQQIAFQEYLGTAGFEAWMEKAQPNEQPITSPWDESGAKQPADYTWAEFEALTGSQQIAFQEYLGTAGFEAWMEKAQPNDQLITSPWEQPGAKQPVDYTWAEFEALTAQQQMAFQDYLGEEGFFSWMEKAQSNDQPIASPWEQPGAKQPVDYTWAEFEALTAQQQMAFQEYLGTAGFEAWMEKAQPNDQPITSPWDEPGAKQPEDYTWAEFEALTGPQQIAFQNYLGEEAFEAWMNRVLG